MIKNKFPDLCKGKNELFCNVNKLEPDVAD